MSGAEALAGLILAGPPLLISWLEHQREFQRMTGTLKGFRAVYRRYKTQASLLEIAFSQTVEVLFLPVLGDLDHLERLKTRPDDPEWRQLEIKLKARLDDRTAQAFIEAVTDLRDDMEELRRKLVSTSPQDVQDTKSTLSRLHSSFQNERNRVKFAATEPTLEEAFAAVRQQLEFLQALLTRSNASVQVRQQVARRTTSMISKTLLQLHKHANAIYNMLSAAWGCSCIEHHRADLLLRHPSSPTVRFDVLLLYHSRHEGTHMPVPPWTERQACICHVYDSSVGHSNGKVMFAEDTKPGADMMAGEVEQSTPTVDLCAKLGDGQLVTKHLALLASTDDVNTYTLNASDQFDLARRNPRVLTLGSLLRADILKGWNKNDIVFLTKDGGEIQYDNPLLRRGFGKSVPDIAKVGFDIPMSTLAILLLELCFGMPLEEKRGKSGQVGMLVEDAVHDRALAISWAEEVAGEAGPEHSAAIWWCLEKMFVRPNDTVWRREFTNMVVEPLQTQYRELCDPEL
ncbi:hypothetical protein LTR78_001209 [Recurvomyces mirabilis]|uniref:Uncharacterized protein n=1 Tax=Recurvomyces mirabilis TaxID=574656 RepID=A0AAE0WWD8_9PEZI|nr:hypothetical protein LTR78_001209 [Recurvomyces mirabilis]KAK5161185.1 hypothetical protein LTS14_000981 [Recurvomyces mirabilis]